MFKVCIAPKKTPTFKSFQKRNLEVAKVENDEFFGFTKSNFGKSHLMYEAFHAKYGDTISTPVEGVPPEYGLRQISTKNLDFVAHVFQSKKYYDRPTAPYIASSYDYLSGTSGVVGIVFAPQNQWGHVRKIGNRALLTPKVVSGFMEDMKQ